MPGKPFQSKLLPYLDFIRECRKRRVSYRRIAAELRSQFGVETHHTTILSFYQTYSRIPIIPSMREAKQAQRKASAFDGITWIQGNFDPEEFFISTRKKPHR